MDTGFLGDTGVPRWKMTGRLIVLEGADGAGTTTQATLLSKEIGNLLGDEDACSVTSEPSIGPIGELLRRYLQWDDPPPLDTMELLFRADRLEHVRNVLRPELKAGTIILCDRYYPSLLVYQTIGKKSYYDRLRMMTLLHAKTFVEDAVLRPDLILYLDADPKVLRERRRYRGIPPECYEKDDDQRSVVTGYRLWFETQLFNAIETRVKIDATQPVEKVTTDCMAAIREKLPDIFTDSSGVALARRRR